MARGEPKFVVYLGITPWGITSAFRLYLDYAVALLTKLLHLRDGLKGKFFPGSFVIGKSSLSVMSSGLVFHVRPDSSDLLMISGGHEPLTAELFDPKPGQTVIDVGAHIGLYSLKAAQRGARVIAVEPNPENYSLLQKNVSANRLNNVLCLNVALSNKTEVRELYYFPRDASTSSLQEHWPVEWQVRKDRDVKKSARVKCQTLDSVVEEFQVSHVDWLKIDVEGNEVRVLESGGRALSLADNLILEVSSGNEVACHHMTTNAGLALVRREVGPAVSNWYLRRRRFVTTK